MKRQRKTRFISDRSVVFSLTAMVLVGLLSALVAPVATGISLRSEVIQANFEEAETDISTRLLESSRQTFAGMQFREQNWVIGTGETDVVSSPAALSRNDIEFMQHNWDFGTGQPLVDAPVRGNLDPGSNTFTGNQSRTRTRPPGGEMNNYRFIEENVQLPGARISSDGPGDGLQVYRFIEENTYLPGSHTEEVNSGLPTDQGFGADGY